MLPLAQEYVGSRCDIKSMTNEFFTSADIIKIDKDALEFSVGEGEVMALLKFRETVKIFVHNRNLPPQILTGVAYLSTVNFARIENIKPIEEFEKRGAFRVGTNVEGDMIRLMDEEEQEEFDIRLAEADEQTAEKMQESIKFKAKVIDISLTGMRISTQVKLEQNLRYYMEVELLEQPITVFLRVQRVIKTRKGEVQYGCVFFDFTERQKDRLCQILFKLQREERYRREKAAGRA